MMLENPAGPLIVKEEKNSRPDRPIRIMKAQMKAQDQGCNPSPRTSMTMGERFVEARDQRHHRDPSRDESMPDADYAIYTTDSSRRTPESSGSQSSVNLPKGHGT